ncbi:Zinc-regulated TonB-dependent outer membrane receptor [hydrothermal vent metagenome]|uniref:Zinc-regulated TonB-dependent outer membrane receptor n=1 Tax=hydrothermal vent metagenome TaxID=652676 RepID=A0A1W1EKC7_9ZZZZ
MKKFLISSALLSTIINASNITNEDLTSELESAKVSTSKTANSGFMPSISLIVDMSYSKESLDVDTSHVEIPGLMSGGGDEGELVGNDGFNLNYAELAIGASVDTYFNLMSIFHLTKDSFEIEEAYVTTSSLPFNLKAKIGKFKSDFGYLNNKHHHSYNFADKPLIYMAFLGEEGLNDEGVQLQYVLPTPFYMMAGFEAFQGLVEPSFGYQGFGGIVEDTKYPSLFVGYIKSSFDIAGGTLLAGVSMAKGDAKLNNLENEDTAEAFDGETTLYGIDLTYKKYFSSNHSLSLSGEYLYREMIGDRIIPIVGGFNRFDLEKNQGGFYSEIVYQYDKNIRAGLRYSAITQNDVFINGIDRDIEDDISVTSAMLEYNPSEYSRIRLQYNHNASLYNEDGTINNKNDITLQFNYSIGAHGAHSF